MNKTFIKIIYFTAAAACLFTNVGPATALLTGILFSLFLENPWPGQTSKAGKFLLQISVTGLGFGLALGDILKTGRASLAFTLAGIGLTLGLGFLLGKAFRLKKNTTLLISFGTAICGGSAIASMAPVLQAEEEETAIALATVFSLNSLALLLFPLVGQALNLSQPIFGIWAGMAIHDTSSVVGAATAYGAKALAVGTTVKLTRALWITPLVLIAGWLKNKNTKTSVPLFILGFIGAATLRTLLPQYTPAWLILSSASRQLLILTLFFIGCSIHRDVLKKTGIKPLWHGTLLWFLVSTLTLTALVAFPPAIHL